MFYGGIDPRLKVDDPGAGMLRAAVGKVCLMLNALLVLGYAAVQICALVFAFRAIQITRTSQGAAAWVVFLVALPLVWRRRPGSTNATV